MPSLVATITGLALIAHASAHVSLINIYGSNNVIGHAFGVNLYGKYPRTQGLPGDAGGDSGVFQTGTDNPSPACGNTPELGPIDIPAWLDQSEGSGLPAAYTNMSVVIEAFQVNRDGGGPMSCQYSEDATATSWKPMGMILNQAGNFGIQNQVRTNETVVAQFPPDARCTGGWTGTACIVRCLTGVNKRFGGCFAVKLSDSVGKQVSATPNGSVPTEIPRIDSPTAASDSVIPEAQLDAIAKQVISEMKKQGLVIEAGSSGKCPISVQPTNVTYDASDAVDDARNGIPPKPIVPVNNSTSNASVAAGKQDAHPPALSPPATHPTENSTRDASDLDDLGVNTGITTGATSNNSVVIAPEPPTNDLANKTSGTIVAPASNNPAPVLKPDRPSRCRSRSHQARRHV